MHSRSVLSQQTVARAIALRDADEPEAAIRLLSDALVADRGNPLLWQMLGLCHRACDDSTAAIAALAKAADLAPTDAKIAHARAHVALEAGLPATTLFDAAARLLPGDGSVLIGRSAAQMAEGAVELALRELSAVTRGNPMWVEGHGALADMHWLLGHESQFVSSYVDAIKAHPRATLLWLAMLDRYVRVERYDWADQALHAASRILGDDPDLGPMRAICASENGRADEADERFAALDVVANSAVAARYMRHQLRCNRPDMAVTAGEAALGKPDEGQIWPYLATAWRMIDDPRWQWLEGDERLISVVALYSPEDLARLAPVLRGLHSGLHAPLGQSVRNGSQTDGPLFSRIEPEIRELRDRLLGAVTDHLRQLPKRDPTHPTLKHRAVKPRFAGSWSVRLTGQGFHSNHVHPQGGFSAAFYVAVPPEADSGPAPAGYIQFGVPPKELGVNLDPFRIIKPEPGTLVLFPSTLWHGTLPIGGGERMAVAFDTKIRTN